MAGHDDQQHAQRHDDDVAVLQHEVGQVERLQQRAVGHELEEDHDDEQRQQHAVFADSCAFTKPSRLSWSFCRWLAAVVDRHVAFPSALHDGAHDLFLAGFAGRHFADEAPSFIT